jgi:hypothetical protein
MKAGLYVLGTTENESGSAKYEKGTRRPGYRQKRVQKRKLFNRELTLLLPPKTSPGAQNMKIGLYALGTTGNNFGRTKHENITLRPRYCQKLVSERNIRNLDPTPSVPQKTSLGEQNMKKGTDALGTFETISGG